MKGNSIGNLELGRKFLEEFTKRRIVARKEGKSSDYLWIRNLKKRVKKIGFDRTYGIIFSSVLVQ